MAEGCASDNECDEGQGVAEEVEVELVVLGGQEAVGGVVCVGVNHQVAAHGVVGLGAPDAVRPALPGSVF